MLLFRIYTYPPQTPFIKLDDGFFAELSRSSSNYAVTLVLIRPFAIGLIFILNGVVGLLGFEAKGWQTYAVGLVTW